MTEPEPFTDYKGRWRGRFGIAVGVLAFSAAVIAWVTLAGMDTALGHRLTDSAFWLMGLVTAAVLGVATWESARSRA